jgi:hypothetical protein
LVPKGDRVRRTSGVFEGACERVCVQEREREREFAVSPCMPTGMGETRPPTTPPPGSHPSPSAPPHSKSVLSRLHSKLKGVKKRYKRWRAQRQARHRAVGMTWRSPAVATKYTALPPAPLSAEAIERVRRASKVGRPTPTPPRPPPWRASLPPHSGLLEEKVNTLPVFRASWVV